MSFDGYDIFTDDVSIKQKGIELGHKITWIEEYFGYANNTVYQIQESAIKRTKIIEEHLKEVKLNHTSLIDGLKTDIMSRLIFLDEIKIILEIRQNVLFLFSGLLYQSFGILDVAQKLGYTNEGVWDIVDAKLVQVTFESKAASDYKYLFQIEEDSIKVEEAVELNKFVEEKLKHITIDEKQYPAHAFFLTDNAWDLYLNPIYPILEKFRSEKTPFVIFTLDTESTTHLQKRGYTVYSIYTDLHEILYKVVERIPLPTEDDVRKYIDSKYFDIIDKLIKNIKKLQSELNISTASKLDAHEINVLRSETSEIETYSSAIKTQSGRHIGESGFSITEKIYFWIARNYPTYSKYSIVRVCGSLSSPLFAKLGKKIEEKRKQEEIKRKELLEKIKKRQSEKRIELEKRINIIQDIQKSQINEKNQNKFDEVQILSSEKKLQLAKEIEQFRKIQLRKEKEFEDEMRRNRFTSAQKILVDFFEKSHTIPKESDILLDCLAKIINNDTNVLYLARIVGAVILLDKIFERFRFKKILVSSGGSPDIDLVCSVAKKHVVQSYVMTIHPYEEYNPFYKMILNADKIFVAGERLKQEFQHLGFSEDRLLITGNPKFDYLNKKFADHILSDISDKRLVIVANSRWNDNDEQWMSDLIKYCNQRGLNVLIKIHPVYRNWKQDLNQEKIKKINELCSGLKYNITLDADLSDLLPKAALLITEFSWTGFEASLCDVPLIVTNFFNKEYSQYSLQYDKEKIALYAKNTTELFECIKQILEDEDTQIRLKKAREILNMGFNYLNDGKAAERIYDILTRD